LGVASEGVRQEAGVVERAGRGVGPRAFARRGLRGSGGQAGLLGRTFGGWRGRDGRVGPRGRRGSLGPRPDAKKISFGLPAERIKRNGKKIRQV